MQFGGNISEELTIWASFARHMFSSELHIKAHWEYTFDLGST